MYEIPLFPLNTVLFPGTPVQLHIFEPRYLQMIDRCLKERAPFGVVLIREGREALGPLAEPYELGCSAQIVDVAHLEGGRMNIVAIGLERIRIHQVERGRLPYLLGMVENAPLESSPLAALDIAAGTLRSRMSRYFERLSAGGGGEYEVERLPEHPLALAYTGAALLQIPSAQKQDLLALEQAGALVERVATLYQRELALLQATLTGESRAIGSFSAN